MRVQASVTTRHDRGGGRARWACGPVLVVAAVLAALLPARVAAHGTPDDRLAHALDVSVTFPDAGLVAGEQLCLSLFAGEVNDAADLTSPVLSECLGSDATEVRFDGLTHGPYTLVVPAPGSVVGQERYQGQIIGTSVPDTERDAFAITVALALSGEVAGTTGSVAVNVFGCPPGTDGGGDATVWKSECDALASGVPVSLSGIGSIDDTSEQAITGEETAKPGRVEFSNLPAGDYQLNDQLPEDAPQTAAVFVESSIDGSITPLEPAETLALRPTEVKSVAYFVVLEPEPADTAATDPADDSTSGNPDIAGASTTAATTPTPPAGLADPAVTGGLPTEPADPAPAGATPTPEE